MFVNKSNKNKLFSFKLYRVKDKYFKDLGHISFPIYFYVTGSNGVIMEQKLIKFVTCFFFQIFC